MEYVFIPTDEFVKSLKALAKKYKSIKDDLKEFETEFVTSNGTVGSDLGGGYRKVRVAIQSKGRGKSGGARIITYDLCLKMEERNVVLVDIYDKSDRATMKDSEYKGIIKRFLGE